MFGDHNLTSSPVTVLMPKLSGAPHESALIKRTGAARASCSYFVSYPHHNPTQANDRDFPSLSPHDLRHTAASLAVSAGANVTAVQRMLGHASAAMTLDVYADLFDDDMDAVAAALDHGATESIVGKVGANAPCSGTKTG